jgi:hypothetical protein
MVDVSHNGDVPERVWPLITAHEGARL